MATQQVKAAEKQRVLGIVPNFYANYDSNPAPMTVKLKFKLALRTAVDPVTIFGIAMIAGLDQAGNTPDYQQGAKGYGQRFGAVAAGGFTDIMIGGAILPSVLHQDPRYFYQGKGRQVSLLPCHYLPIHLQGRQRSEAAELFQPGWRFGGIGA